MKLVVDMIAEETAWDKTRLQQFAKANRVNYREHHSLVILNYMEDIANHHWNDFNRQCRGLIVDMAAQTLIAHPFDKFFNLNAHPDTMLASLPLVSGYTIAHKYDGSMVTVFRYQGQVSFATRMSFQNPQTEWAEQVYRSRYPQLAEVPLEQFTLIFELVAPENHVIVRYDEADLVLIGVRDLTTHRQLSYTEVVAFAEQYQLKAPVLMDMTFEALCELAHHGMDEDIEEGWVVGFNNGLCVKVKTWQYLAHVHIKRLGLSRKQLLKSYCDWDKAKWLSFLTKLPVEIQEAVRTYGELVQAKIEAVIAEAQKAYYTYQHIESQKDFALVVQRECAPELASLLFLLRNNKSPESVIRKRAEFFIHDEGVEEVVQPLMIKEWAWQMAD